MCPQNGATAPGTFPHLTLPVLPFVLRILGVYWMGLLDCELPKQGCVILIFISFLTPGLVFGTQKELDKCLPAG